MRMRMRISPSREFILPPDAQSDFKLSFTSLGLEVKPNFNVTYDLFCDMEW
jgi:hypothetical protein